jgi:CheY-like chemotaxis protein/anti-sigma regulatory factor (Ser/Thr protein kinase)
VTVSYAQDGIQALEQIKDNSFDAVLTDFQMPNLDGLELLERMTQNCPGVPVVVITGCGNEATAVRALQAGAASYLNKQDLDTLLVDTMQNVLALSQTRLNRRRLISSLNQQTAEFILENDVQLVTPLITWLQDQLVTMRLGDDAQILRVGVALHEALTNAIYHGNLELDSALRQEDETVFYDLAEARRVQTPYATRRVKVLATASRDMVSYEIKDEGPGFDVHRVADPTDVENLLRVGGRGLLLIRSFMDEVNHNDKGNEVTLVKRFTPPPTTQGDSSSSQTELQFA